MTVTYTVGDTREVIKGIADGSVDLIASSPPFLALRSYVPQDHHAKGDEIGSEANPSAFIDMLLGLTAEWGRVLAAHGSIAIELGDTYAGSGGGGGDYLPGGLRYGQVGFDGSAAREHNAANWRQKNATPDAWPRAKSLALIPQLYAVALAYGLNPLTGAPSPAGRWLVRNVIVWHRPNPAVGALGDKVRPSTSYIVIATRSPKRWFDLTAVRSQVSDNSHGGGTWTTQGGLNGSAGEIGKTLANPAGAPPLDAWFDEYDTAQIVEGEEMTRHTRSQDVAFPSTLSPFDEYDGTHDTWTLTTQPSRLAHYAMWPAKLAERLILSMCPLSVCSDCGEPRRRMETATRTTDDHYGDWQLTRIGGTRLAHHGSTTNETLGWTDCGHGEWGPSYHGPNDRWESSYRPGLVLDPFAGSGTTLAVADLHGRDAIGIDFNSENKAIYPARYDEVKRALFGTPAPMPGQGDLFAEVAG